MTRDEEIDEARTLVENDWLVTRTWNALHFAELTDEQAAAMFEDRSVTDSVRLACGHTVGYVSIPGVLTRMGAMRCSGCCRAKGYPVGKGSPKNDPACRALLGLDTP